MVEATSASLWKPLALSGLIPVFPSPQIDFTADQIEGEYSQLRLPQDTLCRPPLEEEDGVIVIPVLLIAHPYLLIFTQDM